MDTIQVTADADALRKQAARLIQAGRIGVARPLVAAAQALAPPSAELTLVAARLAVASGDWTGALRELDSGITAEPAHAGLRKCRGDVRQRLGDHEGAARDAAEAVYLAPADPQAKFTLGMALRNLGLTADAVVCLAEAVAGAPDNPDAREALAATLETAGDADAALRVLTEGIAMCPGAVSMRNAGMLLCIRRRDFAQAVIIAETAQAAGVSDACTYGMRGHALSSLGEHEHAALAYQDALKLGPEDPYVRHLVVSSGAMPDSKRAPDEYVRTVFDGYADSFETHLISLRYIVPVAIRALLQSHPKVAAGSPLGPVLDLGCGTGLVALMISDLATGPVTGVDLSPRMLSHARAKGLYAELRVGEIVADLTRYKQRWPLIVAGDVLCYFGALEEVFDLVGQRLEADGWFVFSVEQMLPDYDGVMPGNGRWALHRQGRYVHAEDYIYDTVFAAGFRILRLDRPILRQEAGVDVPGFLFAVERIHHDG